MFESLGQFVSRFWALLICAWVALLAVLLNIAPPLSSVLQEGEFAFLPSDSPSLVAERLQQRGFPGDRARSHIVVVIRRPGSDTKRLGPEDRQYIANRFVKILRALGVHPLDELQTRSEAEQAELDAIAAEFPELRLTPDEQHLVHRLRDWTNPFVGHLLDSEDGRATLVLIDLHTEFIGDGHHPILRKLEELVEILGTRSRAQWKDLNARLDGDPDLDWSKPPGLDILLSGSATVGRDMRTAGLESAKRTELVTVILVLVLLIGIYRAPLLALIPLATVALSVAVAMLFLSLLAHAGWISLFKDIQTYVTVIVYGAGVDYCLFLIARYKEELDRTGSYNEAVADSLGKVGHALTASAGTVICGIGMMSFAEFGKFRQAGIGISISLGICLLAALTFTPSLMRLAGKWAFWPHVRKESIRRSGWLSPTKLMDLFARSDLMNRGWEWITCRVRRYPGRILGVSLLLMLPFAVIGVVYHNHLSYALMSDLPANYTSVNGARAVQDHFPAGTTGPVSVLLKNPALNFTDSETIEILSELTRKIEDERETLDVSDLRSIVDPTGISPVARDKEARELERIAAAPTSTKLAETRIRNSRIHDTYVSQSEEFKDQITRLDIVFRNDPFSRDSIANFVRFRDAMRQLVAEFDASARALREELIAEMEPGTPPEELPPEIPDTEVYYLGATPSILDLRDVTSRDQVRIDILVLGGVFLILVLLLRRIAISAYLLVTVFFSYLATLGLAMSIFYLLDPAGFAGLDWKVPMFLFTILIAVGEDYNIFLMTRIDEEQKRLGLVEGTLYALRKTGSIISSCGIIMAGTFSSLLAGTLVGMQQLGLALALGVLLDTFVVRPILVPSWLVLLYRGKFGRLGRWLGAPQVPDLSTPADLEPAVAMEESKSN